MSPTEAEKFIISKITVTRQAVTIAKAHAINHYETDTQALINGFLRNIDAVMPQQVVIHQSVASNSVLTRVAESISWQLAMCEAIWGLIHANVFVPIDFSMPHLTWHVSWTTVVPGSGGETSGWDFSRFALNVPSRIKIAPSWESKQEQPLTDGDLYIHEISISNIHPEVEEALRDAVKCFRHELFTPALAMLAKASEGAWYELGIALAKALPNAAKPTADKHIREFNDPFISNAKKIQLVLKLYEHSGLQLVKESSGVDDNSLKQTSVWSDVVRESRNVVHYGVEPSMRNTYEKVAALLMGAIPHIKLIYRIYSAAEAIMGDKQQG